MQDAVILGATSVAQKRRCQTVKAVFLKVMQTEKTLIRVHLVLKLKVPNIIN